MGTAKTLAQDVFPCFSQGLLDRHGKAVNAEISAVAWDGERLVMASDKPIPGENRSAIFALECHQGCPQPDTLNYYTAPLLRSASKYEDFALTASGTHMVATTGFDRFSSDNADSHLYNQLLVWPIGMPDSARVIGDTTDDDIDSSADLRVQLSRVLDAPYFKIEGLACLPAAQPLDGNQDWTDDWLVFGVREIGQDYTDFRYAVCLVGAPYRMDGDDLVFTGDFRVLYDFDPEGWAGVHYTVGVSSLEYDPYNQRLFILTSFETEHDDGTPANGGYLWQISLANFFARKDPMLIEYTGGDVVEFGNKAEGLAVLDDERVLVAYDPDRELTLTQGQAKAMREPHEAPYTLLSIAS